MKWEKQNVRALRSKCGAELIRERVRGAFEL